MFLRVRHFRSASTTNHLVCLAQGTRGHHRLLLLQQHLLWHHSSFQRNKINFIYFLSFCCCQNPLQVPPQQVQQTDVGVLSPASSSISVPAPSLATAQRSAAHPLHWVTLHKWCWREILTASGKQICSFGKGNSSWHFHFPLPDKLPQAPWLILHPVPASWLSPDHPYFHTDQSHIALKDKRFAASLALSSF